MACCNPLIISDYLSYGRKLKTMQLHLEDIKIFGTNNNAKCEPMSKISEASASNKKLSTFITSDR